MFNKQIHRRAVNEFCSGKYTVKELAEEQYDLDFFKEIFYESIEWFREHKAINDYSLNALYAVIDITKLAVWDHFRREEAEPAIIRRVIGDVDEFSEDHPGEGLRKMYWQIQPEGMGRDKFCRTFMQLGYTVRRVTYPI